MFYSYNKKQIGKEILKLRLSKKMTQKHVCRLSSINEDSLRRIEHGEVIPRYDTLLSLSKAFKIDMVNYMKYISPNFKIFNLYNQLDHHIINNNYEEISKVKKDFDTIYNSIPFEEISSYEEVEQLRLFFDGINDYVNGRYTEAINSLVLALIIKNSDFSLKGFDAFIYSSFELRILLLIAIIKVIDDDIDDSTKLLEFIYYQLQKQEFSEISDTKILLKTVLNIAYNYHRKNDNEQVILFSNIGIDICLEHDLIYLLGHFFYRKSIAENFLGIADSQNDFHLSMDLIKLTSSTELYNEYKKVSKNKYGLEA